MEHYLIKKLVFKNIDCFFERLSLRPAGSECFSDPKYSQSLYVICIMHNLFFNGSWIGEMLAQALECFFNIFLCPTKTFEEISCF